MQRRAVDPSIVGITGIRNVVKPSGFIFKQIGRCVSHLIDIGTTCIRNGRNGSHVDRKSRGPEVTWTGSHVDRKSRGPEVTWTGSHVDRKSRGPEVAGSRH